METSIIDKTKPVKSPVLLLAFNRPEKTQKVFEVIRKVKPKKLYVFIDGPREGRSDDVINCNKVKVIVQKVDWECETHYSFQEKNLGCSMAGYSSWDWLFKTEEEVIFFEDDGVPSECFFWYAQELLERYRYDNRIMLIHSENFGVTQGNASYFFTRSGSGTYGTAWWKRVHQLYEYELESYADTVNSKQFISSFPYKLAYDIRKLSFEHYLKVGGRVYQTYDVQLLYMTNKYKMYSIVPNINMVTNIGWDEDATNNTLGKDSISKYANITRYEITSIAHPDSIIINEHFEKWYYRYRYWNSKNWLQMAIWYYSRKIGNLIPFVPEIYHFVKKNINRTK